MEADGQAPKKPLAEFKILLADKVFCKISRANVELATS